jgi:mycofactocin precursor
MTARSMVTELTPPHTVTNIRRRRPCRHLGVTARHRRIPMQHDNRADPTRADASSRSTDVTDDLDISDDPGIAEELLVEEISIDGMCGVY